MIVRYGDWGYRSLHGQSIKTRVEALVVVFAAAQYLVYTDNPLKQGLKLVDGLELLVGEVSTRTIH